MTSLVNMIFSTATKQRGGFSHCPEETHQTTVGLFRESIEIMRELRYGEEGTITTMGQRVNVLSIAPATSQVPCFGDESNHRPTF